MREKGLTICPWEDVKWRSDDELAVPVFEPFGVAERAIFDPAQRQPITPRYRRRTVATHYVLLS